MSIPFAAFIGKLKRERTERQKSAIGYLLYLDMFILLLFLYVFTPFFYEITAPPAQSLPSLDQTTGQTIEQFCALFPRMSVAAAEPPISAKEKIHPSINQTTGQPPLNSSEGVTYSTNGGGGRTIKTPLGLMAEATRACASAGFKSVDCRNILLAISYHETQGWTDFTGDSGCSTGWVHINRCVHTHITLAKSMDAAFAFPWTAQRLKAYGYPTARTAAIQCHNGCYATNGYSAKIKNLVDRFPK